jgi:alcohol dehydrogenase
MESAILPFDYSPRTRILFGSNSVDRLGDLAAELGGHRALIVTDPGIVAAGHVDRARHALEGAGVQVVVFDQVRENPTTRDVDDCLTVAKDAGIDLIVGLGGGSSLDTAKGCNFLLTNGGRMQDYWGVGKAQKAMLPLIAVPTTAGTGSECQSFALIADEETHQKMACGDLKAAAKVAVLDPTLTLSQPQNVTACTGIDAIAHAVETAVTRKRNALSILYSREAFRLLINHFKRVLSAPDDLDARASMLLGAAYAGTAIENSMLGAAHSAANPLTAHYGTVHGQAVGMMLPHVVRFNAQDRAAAEAYRDLAVYTGLTERTSSAEGAADMLACALEQCLAAAGMRVGLREAGVTEAMVPTLATEASQQWTATYNPRPITTVDFESLYLNALAGQRN